MTVWDGNAAEFLDGVAARCEHCGDVVVEWDKIEFYSVRYRGEEGRDDRR